MYVHRNLSTGAAATLSAVLLLASFGTTGGPIYASPPSRPSMQSLEPEAGAWHTLVLQSPNQIVIPAPPDAATTRAELQQLIQLTAARGSADRDQVRFWDAGSPGYRWNEMLIAEAAKNIPRGRAQGALALLNVAIYDATVAAWDAKYTYARPRPSDLDPGLSTLVATSPSPAYPAEHAVAAGAASAVLGYLYPEQAEAFDRQAEAAGWSRVLAGVQYPSDVSAGLELGRAVGALVVDRARTDGTDAVWQGSVPTGPGMWNGTGPLLPEAATWQPRSLSSASQFRPAPPPAFDSPEMTRELAEVKTYTHTPATNQIAFFWQYPQTVGSEVVYWNEQTSRKLAESRLDLDAPWAARAYALQTVAVDDAFIACWDAKYTYWRIRPFQMDPTIQPLFPNPPNHPSYPSAHGCHSGAAAAVLGSLFPTDAIELTRQADEATEARLWAGIHFRSDLEAGLRLGRQVAQTTIEWAQAEP
jgi:PAP2 superfamily